MQATIERDQPWPGDAVTITMRPTKEYPLELARPSQELLEALTTTYWRRSATSLTLKGKAAMGWYAEPYMGGTQPYLFFRWQVGKPASEDTAQLAGDAKLLSWVGSTVPVDAMWDTKRDSFRGFRLQVSRKALAPLCEMEWMKPRLMPRRWGAAIEQPSPDLFHIWIALFNT